MILVCGTSDPGGWLSLKTGSADEANVVDWYRRNQAATMLAFGGQFPVSVS